jgi:hypothetical protein
MAERVHEPLLALLMASASVAAKEDLVAEVAAPGSELRT